MVWQGIFPSHKHAKLHHLATLFNDTNVVSNPVKGDQIVRDVFCQTFAKSCQITNNILQIIMQNTGKTLQNFFIKGFTLTMDPIPTVLLRLFRQNSKHKKWGARPPQKKVGGLGPCGPPVPPPMVLWLQLFCSRAILSHSDLLTAQCIAKISTTVDQK